MAAIYDNKRRHAIEDDTDRVVDIFSLSRELRKGHKYYCPECRNEMYPTFGQKYVHHFRHLGTVCQKNNYLHATAEYMFLEEYNRCLDTGEPFLLELHSHVDCDNQCTERRNRICMAHKNTIIVDLTKIYKNVKREYRVQVDDHFRRPDILLTSETGEQLWIEIWVTHETTEEKRKDGHIVELKIFNEKDLEQIRNHKLVKTTDNELAVRLFNVEFDELCIVSKEEYKSNECPNFKPLHSRYSRGSKQLSLYKKSSYKSTPRKPAAQMVVSAEEIDLDSIEWVDLGLPSGTLWAKQDYASEVNFPTAYHSYRKHLPSFAEAKELEKHYHEKTWNPETKEMTYIGPNGNSISFKIKGDHSSYWLNSYEVWNDLGQCIHIHSDKRIFVNDMSQEMSGNVRLVKHHSIKPKISEPSLFDELDH